MKRFLTLALLLLGAIYLFLPNQLNNQLPEKKTDTPSSSQIIASQTIEARGAVLMDRDNGHIIYAHNANDRLYPASTTKILTALVALENLDPREPIKVGREILLIPKDGSRAGLYEGQEISLFDLIRALLLPSGNDAAYTIAVHTARKLSQNDNLDEQECLTYFTDLMNERAAEAGAKDSHFSNPDGYHNDDHYSTAYDLAMIAKAAMQNPIFCEIAATTDYPLPDASMHYYQISPDTSGNISASAAWHNTNQLLDKNSPYYYPQATGIKTGHTTPAGYCLVSSATQGSLNLIAVVLNSSEKGVWKDSISLLKNGFSNYKPEPKPDPVTKRLSNSKFLRLAVGTLLLYMIIRLLIGTRPRAKAKKR